MSPTEIRSATAKSQNIPFYSHHGFEVLGEIQVGAAPVVFPMLRPPLGKPT